MTPNPKYKVEEKFRGSGVVHFKTSKYPQTVGWVRDDNNPDGFVLMGKYHWPDHIMNGIRDSIRQYLDSTH